ncbi:MAG: hypothetical protein V3V00_10160, partial [Saprospiraceae bacterium]
MRLFYFVLILFCCGINCTPSKTNSEIDIDKSFIDRQNDKLFPAEAHIFAKNFPEEKFALNAYRKALTEVKKSKNQNIKRNGLWEVQGPGNIGGRINSIAVHPINSNEIMLGYALGGIFKTDDNGSTWNPIFDKQDILTISDVKYDPNNGDVIYVGTGDHNISGYPVTGNGVYKSTDGGVSWDNIGLSQAGVISEIGISQSNSDIIYAASMGLPFERNSDRGLYKSSNGGAQWDRVFYLNDSTGVIDIEVHPNNPNIVYAATWTRIRNNRESILESSETGIYKTIDGGDNWTKLINGLPDGDLVRPGLAMFPSNPDVVFAMFTHYNTDTICSIGYHLKGIYKTSDAGDTWATVNTAEDSGLPCSVLSGFGWYFGQLRVSPLDDNILYILGVDTYSTSDGGETWNIAVPPWYTYSVHADKHDLVFSENQLLLATDGGAYRSIEGSGEWEDIENIVSTQFYRVALSDFKKGEYFGGAQDNGTTGGYQDSINQWDRIFGGDGFQMIFHPENPDIHYVETQNGRIRITLDGGLSYIGASDGLSGNKNWDMQYIMSSHNSDVMYTGTDRMYRSISSDVPEWMAISDILTDTVDLTTAHSHSISTLCESPIDNSILYCGTSDGLVWNSSDFGTSWDLISEGLPRRYISDIRASKVDENTVYLSIQGYKDNDNTPYIYKSIDRGASWEHIQYNLPQIAINDIAISDNLGIDDLFIATDGGVYSLNTSIEQWQLIGDNMPIIPVYDLALEKDDLGKDIILVAGSFA